jgi:hypothetical protein
MRHEQVETFRARDDHGGTHVVCVMQHFRLVQKPNASTAWEKSHLRFIVDDEYEFRQEVEKPLVLPGLGKLTRLP